MIQFNLLPDVKLEYIKAQRSKHLVVVTAAIIAAATLVLFLLLLLVNLTQRKHLSDLNKDIATYTKQLQNTPDLNKILTIQNQLNSLPALHDKRPIASRLFNYLTKVTPAQASITRLHVDFTTNTMTIVGGANTISTVNTYADTLKFTTFATTDGSKKGQAFNKVVLTSFNRSDKTTSYEINLSFDPAIFDGASDVTLTVPKTITTRSETEKPAALFQTQGGL